MLEASSTNSELKGGWTEWFEKHEERIAWATLIGVVALTAIALGLFVASIDSLKQKFVPSPDGRIDIFGNRTGGYETSPIGKLGTPVVLATAMGVPFGGLAVIGAICWISSLKTDEKSPDSGERAKAIRNIALIVSMAILLLGLSLWVSASALRHSRAFSDPENASFFTDQNGWDAYGESLMTRAKVGSYIFATGLASMFSIGAITLVSAIWKRFHPIEQDHELQLLSPGKQGTDQ